MMKVEEEVGVGSGWRNRRCPNKEDASSGWRTIIDVFARRDFPLLHPHFHRSGLHLPRPVLRGENALVVSHLGGLCWLAAGKV